MEHRVLFAHLSFLLFAACASVPDSGTAVSSPPPTGLVSAPESKSSPVQTGPDRTKITALAIDSQCAKTSHGEKQGRPPSNYMAGIALSFARAVCNLDKISVQAASMPISAASTDALALYSVKAADPATRLENVYALMIGSAAHESSWRWCCGRDANNATSGTADTAEAGLYQTSYNSHTAHPALSQLFAEFKTTPQGCFAAEYKGKTTCSDSNMKTWGTGDGATFQQLSKNCPGFASEYAAIMFRVKLSHYGPIKRKTALLVTSCVSMFDQIRAAVAASPGICSSL